MSDSVIWTPSTSGVFSTKSAHHHLSSFKPASPSPLSKVCWKALWKLNLNHRLKLFLWKMVWNIYYPYQGTHLLFHTKFSL
jgi:hypothetical protein